MQLMTAAALTAPAVAGELPGFSPALAAVHIAAALLEREMDLLAATAPAAAAVAPVPPAAGLLQHPQQRAVAGTAGGAAAGGQHVHIHPG